MRDEESAGSRRGNSRQDPSASADTPYIPRTRLPAGAAAASGTGHVTSPSPVELGATNRALTAQAFSLNLLPTVRRRS